MPFLLLFIIIFFCLTVIFIGYKMSKISAVFIFTSTVLSKREEGQRFLENVRVSPVLMVIAPFVTLCIINFVMSIITTYLANMMIGGIQGSLSITVVLIFFAFFTISYLFFTYKQYKKLNDDFIQNQEETSQQVLGTFL